MQKKKKVSVFSVVKKAIIVGFLDNRIKMWKKLNSLEDVRPLVWINDIPWHELNVDNELTNKTITGFSKFLETRLRRTIYQWKHMRADMIVEPTLPCYLIINDTGFGIVEKMETVKIDKNSDIISRNYNKLVF